MTELQDPDLTRRAALGEPEALAVFYDRHASRFYFLAHKNARDEGEGRHLLYAAMTGFLNRVAAGALSPEAGAALLARMTVPDLLPPREWKAELLKSYGKEKRLDSRYVLKITAAAGWLAAVCALVMGGALVKGLKTRLTAEEARARNAAATAVIPLLAESGMILPLQDPEGSPSVEAKLFLALNNQGAVFIAQGLKQPPAGSVYKMWLVKDGTPMASGTFSPGPDGGAILPVTPGEPLKNFQAILLTEETSADSPTPSGPTRLAAQLR